MRQNNDSAEWNFDDSSESSTKITVLSKAQESILLKELPEVEKKDGY